MIGRCGNFSSLEDKILEDELIPVSPKLIWRQPVRQGTEVMWPPAPWLSANLRALFLYRLSPPLLYRSVLSEDLRRLVDRKRFHGVMTMPGHGCCAKHRVVYRLLGGFDRGEE